MVINGEMYNAILKYINDCGFVFLISSLHDKITKHINKVYDILILNKIPVYDPIDDDIYCLALKDDNGFLLYLAGVKCHIIKNYTLMKQYYLHAIDLNNHHAMCYLGYYYDTVENNNELTKKYYIMALNFGNSDVHCCLGRFYQCKEIDYDLMKKYYENAIENKDQIAMTNLGSYYLEIEQNFKLTKKYYLMAIEMGYSIAMRNLGHLYEIVKKNNTKAEKYYLLALNNKCDQAIDDLEKLYKKQNNIIKFWDALMGLSENNVTNNVFIKCQEYLLKPQFVKYLEQLNNEHINLSVVMCSKCYINKICFNNVICLDCTLNAHN